MKETIRTASVLEIYNASIDELAKQKSKLVLKLNLLRASNTGASIGSILLYILLSAFVLSAGYLAMFYLFSSPERIAKENLTFVHFITSQVSGGLALWGIISYSKYRKKKKEDIEIEKQKLNQRINEINNQITEKEVRKKSLLNAEEVIVSKDLKVVQDNITTEKFSESVINSELEKICPMCAETIKKAAKVCRYCGHKF